MKTTTNPDTQQLLLKINKIIAQEKDPEAHPNMDHHYKLIQVEKNDYLEFDIPSYNYCIDVTQKSQNKITKTNLKKDNNTVQKS